ncbi:glycoside hydrolase family 6 protein [Streptomyces sp. CA-294286]|uniref:glycoside hydrolase family 6 protein n=1 Tax=Streptomyces sp. CA-294286 TaxID=3240070 RepID=UPI003D937EED
MRPVQPVPTPSPDPRHRRRRRPLHRRGTLALAALPPLAAGVIWAVTAGPASGAPEPPAPAAGPPAPALTGSPRLYTPLANPDAYKQALKLGQAGGRVGRDAVGIIGMVRTPHAVWYGDQTPAAVEKDARAVTRDAEVDGSMPVLALYNMPGRDCSHYSAGGASNTAEYKAWIDGVAKGIGKRDALVVLEPDSLALLPSECGQGDAKEKTEARYEEVNYAVSTLAALRNTRVYLDTGHAGWHDVAGIVPRLVKGGIKNATGFYTNASNYQTDEANSWYGKLISSCLAHVDAGGKAEDCPSQKGPKAAAEAWIAENVTTPPGSMKHFVTDTSRNGRGPWTPPAGKYTEPQDWCNPPGRGLGVRPTTRTGDPLHDAKLWIKTPGESDGLCLRGTPGPKDPERGTVDPKAGDWFPEQALELVRLANPPLLPPGRAGQPDGREPEGASAGSGIAEGEPDPGR